MADVVTDPADTQTIVIDKMVLRGIVARGVKHGKFTLASGNESDFYIDARLATMDPQGVDLAGREMLRLARAFENAFGKKITAVGGPATAACPLVTATGLRAWRTDKQKLKCFYVRTEPKKHGTKKLIEGAELSADDVVLIVDDVVTTGGSLKRAIEAVRTETLASVVLAVGLVDRNEGGKDVLNDLGVALVTIFSREDFQA